MPAVQPFAPIHSSIAFPSNDQADVWCVALNPDIVEVGPAFQVLTTDEKERANRFRSSTHRCEYVLSRGILREILGRYLNIPPAKIRFEYNLFGKPKLKDDCGGTVLSFNLSHSAGMAVYAVSRCKVGIDIEFVREEIECEQIAQRFFSPDEVHRLHLIPAKEMAQTFYACWTRKEAFIKAHGEGLSLDLRSFTVIDSGDPRPRLHLGRDRRELAHWSLIDLDVPAGYIASLAIESDAGQIGYRQWPLDLQKPTG